MSKKSIKRNKDTQAEAQEATRGRIVADEIEAASQTDSGSDGKGGGLTWNNQSGCEDSATIEKGLITSISIYDRYDTRNEILSLAKEAIGFPELSQEPDKTAPAATAGSSGKQASYYDALKSMQLDGAIFTPIAIPPLPTLILTVGIPRAGKSTWASAYSKANGIPIVSSDAIRSRVNGPHNDFIKETEPIVWMVANYMVGALFAAGHDTVILDATNATRETRNKWRSRDWHITFKVFYTPIDDCVARAKEGGRDHLIPVIHRMADQWEDVQPSEGKAID